MFIWTVNCGTCHSFCTDCIQGIFHRRLFLYFSPSSCTCTVTASSRFRYSATPHVDVGSCASPPLFVRFFFGSNVGSYRLVLTLKGPISYFPSFFRPPIFGWISWLAQLMRLSNSLVSQGWQLAWIPFVDKTPLFGRHQGHPCARGLHPPPLPTLHFPLVFCWSRICSLSLYCLLRRKRDFPSILLSSAPRWCNGTTRPEPGSSILVNTATWIRTPTEVPSNDPSSHDDR